MKKDNRQSEQAKRMLLEYNEFLKGRILTVKDLKEKVEDKLDIVVTERSIQRDLRVLQECIPLLEQWKEGKQVLWSLSSNYVKPNNLPRIESNELFSMHILKAHLRCFKGTIVEKEADELEKKLEKLASGDVFYKECLFWDQNFGTYDYSKHNSLIEEVIGNIVNKEWVHIRYYSVKQDTEKHYDCFFEGLFTFNGIIYVVTYFPYYGKHEALQLHGIKQIEKSNNIYELPEFDFDEFTERRFGVYSSKPMTIRLKIKKKFIGYFSGRKWHKTQRTSYDRNGNLIIEMTVPIGMDLVSWIIGWNEAIKVIKPKSLKDKVISKMKLGLMQYGKCKEA
ncbi:WYL domain-containing transcriptional regulator [Bacteroidetes/Chlorobi group bacterium ChocPot_Mid]|nr:MAG: WYL domain-containing transcriptional regulator [Bacteroidetes/Chlorobi group bacterium ChocPot_Mid]